jgi:hypothetical protein
MSEKAELLYTRRGYAASGPDWRILLDSSGTFRIEEKGLDLLGEVTWVEKHKPKPKQRQREERLYLLVISLIQETKQLKAANERQLELIESLRKEGK